MSQVIKLIHFALTSTLIGIICLLLYISRKSSLSVVPSVNVKLDSRHDKFSRISICDSARKERWAYCFLISDVHPAKDRNLMQWTEVSRDYVIKRVPQFSSPEISGNEKLLFGEDFYHFLN